MITDINAGVPLLGLKHWGRVSSALQVKTKGCCFEKKKIVTKNFFIACLGLYTVVLLVVLVPSSTGSAFIPYIDRAPPDRRGKAYIEP